MHSRVTPLLKNYHTRAFKHPLGVASAPSWPKLQVAAARLLINLLCVELSQGDRVAGDCRQKYHLHTARTLQPLHCGPLPTPHSAEQQWVVQE